MKAQLPNFVNVVSIGKGKKEGEWVEIKSRINPYHITCYNESFVQNYKGEEIKKVVAFNISGLSYYVDMTIEEADKMMGKIDRSLSFKE